VKYEKKTLTETEKAKKKKAKAKKKSKSKKQKQKQKKKANIPVLWVPAEETPAMSPLSLCLNFF